MSKSIAELAIRQNLLSCKQVAEILGVSAGTLAVWRSTGRYNLPFIKCGKLVRYRHGDVEAFIERRTHLHS